MSNVNHPAHYNTGKIEVIEYLEDKDFGLHLANVVKYVSRAGKKNPATEIEDLEKAQWYLERRIEILKARKEGRAPVRPNEMKPREIKRDLFPDPAKEVNFAPTPCPSNGSPIIKAETPMQRINHTP